jgi:hypothetical protein
VSDCSQIFSAEALLRSYQQMAERIAELHDLRRRVREAEVRARARQWHKSSTQTRRTRGLIACKFVRISSAARGAPLHALK